MKKHAVRSPVNCPSNAEIDKAFEILAQQELHWYQLLYFNGLTSPLNGQVIVERGYWHAGDSLHFQTVINVYPSPNHPAIRNAIPSLIHFEAKDHQSKQLAKNLGFTIKNDDTDESVLKKVKIMLDGLGKPVEEYACCSLAKRRQCVCVASFECPLHGTKCVGSHD